MKTAARVLSILSLVFGLIGVFTDFSGSMLIGVFSDDFDSDIDSFMTSILVKMVFSFIIAIIAGVLGIVGSDKKLNNTKTLILGVSTLIFGICLFIPLEKIVSGTLSIIAGILLIITGGGLKYILSKKNRQ